MVAPLLELERELPPPAESEEFHACSCSESVSRVKLNFYLRISKLNKQTKNNVVLKVVFQTHENFLSRPQSGEGGNSLHHYWSRRTRQEQPLSNGSHPLSHSRHRFLLGLRSNLMAQLLWYKNTRRMF